VRSPIYVFARPGQIRCQDSIHNTAYQTEDRKVRDVVSACARGDVRLILPSVASLLPSRTCLLGRRRQDKSIHQAISQRGFLAQCLLEGLPSQDRRCIRKQCISTSFSDNSSCESLCVCSSPYKCSSELSKLEIWIKSQIMLRPAPAFFKLPTTRYDRFC
jgi:hypothetical protein